MTSDDVREMFVKAYDDSRFEKYQNEREELLGQLARLAKALEKRERKRLIEEL